MDSLHQIFRDSYQGNPILVNAPGRINLLGEHLDYNLGQVLPAAVDKKIQFLTSASGDNAFSITAFDFRESRSFDMEDLSPESSWLTYLKGVVHGIRIRGKEVGGVNCVFGGDIPEGAGLSSSAALCCGFAFSLNELFDLSLSKRDIAEIAQFAEHEFAGVKCGIMDQYASLFSEQGHLLLLDCRSMEHEVIPFDPDKYTILLIDSRVKHNLAGSAYNDRRKSCERGVEVLRNKFEHVRSLRDATIDQLEAVGRDLDQTTFVRCQYVLEEMARVKVGVAHLINGDFKAFGELMYASHEGLSKQYKVSCPETDYLVSLAKRFGLTGSRMMGGGFGGCTISLISREDVESFTQEVMVNYKNQFDIEPAFHVVKTSRGVHRVFE